MTTTVYVWRTFSNTSRKFGGFGHVALGVGPHYLSFWPPEHHGKEQSFSYAFEEDLARCGCKPDRKIPISGLDEKAIIRKWQSLSAKSFDNIEFNCCTMAAQLLMFGFEKTMDSASIGKFLKIYGRLIAQPVRSWTRLASYGYREFLVHSPGELENLADWMAHMARD